MSGPNTDYDPVEVTPLQAEEVERARDEALAAIAAADSLEALKAARLAHAGIRGSTDPTVTVPPGPSVPLLSVP